jgi:LmbE family N-acetylglucosaminyl deacetylase
MMALGLGGIGRLLCLGAHCDDIEIGGGGTVLSLVAANPGLVVRWVVFSSGPARRQEALRSAERFLDGARAAAVTVHDFRDGFLPWQGAAVKEAFERLKGEFAPDLVLAPWRHDAHQDHRAVAELTWNTFRDHLILEYEIPKYDGDFASPNLYVPLGERVCQEKVHHLLECFESQHARPWFSRELFMAVLRIRGMEARSATTYAEGFHCRKLVVAPRA